MLADSSCLCSTEWDVYGGIRLVALIVGQSNATMVQETIQSLPYKQVILPSPRSCASARVPARA